MNITVYFVNICCSKLKSLVNSSFEAPVVTGWVGFMAGLYENGKY